MMRQALFVAAIIAVALANRVPRATNDGFRRSGNMKGGTNHTASHQAARVLGGWPSELGAHRFILQCLIKYESQSDPIQCAASLLNENMAITSGKCMSMPKFQFGAREYMTCYYDMQTDAPGTHWELNSTQNLMPAEMFHGRNPEQLTHFWHADVIDVTVHPEHDVVPEVRGNNLAIIKLEPFTSSERGDLVFPEDMVFVNIPHAAPADCSIFSIAGWGMDFYFYVKSGDDIMAEDTERPTALMEARVPLQDHATCMQNLIDNGAEDMSDRDDLICAGCEEGYIDPCFGDEGGPLWIEDENGQVWQHGVISSPPVALACGIEHYNWMYAATHQSLAWMCGMADLADHDMCTNPRSPVVDCSACAECAGCTSCSKIDEMEPNTFEDDGGYGYGYGYGYDGGYGGGYGGYEYYYRTGQKLTKAVLEAASRAMNVDETCQTSAGVTEGEVTWNQPEAPVEEDAAAGDNSMIMYGGGAVVVLIILYFVFSGKDAAE